MFSSLKKTLLNVGKNVGFATNKEEKSKKQANSLNLDAGAEILKHFQKNWETIHATNEENARKAEEVANSIEVISNKILKDKSNAEQIVTVLTASNLRNCIENSLIQMGKMYETCREIEENLVELENVIDEIEYHNMKKMHRFHLAQYESRKNESLNNLKVSLEAGYQKKLQEFEASKGDILQERQQVFQEAFKSDLEIYKSLGTIPKVNLPKKQTSALLEEIEIDFDQNELDQFFEEENNS